MRTINNKVFLLFWGLLLAYSIHAQSFTNNWIDYNQTYYKFPITTTGICRISYAQMSAAGIPVSSINPANFQIFGRGEEQYIYIYNQLSGVMSPGDYIEFYAQRNDGWYDSELYLNPNHQPNPDYSLFTDTAFYYLTWNSSFNNRRLTSETDINFSTYPQTPSVIRVERQYYSTNYLEGLPLRESDNGTTWNPEYANGEGFYGSPFYLGGSRTYSVPTKNASSSGDAIVQFLVHAASDYRPLTLDHHLRVQFAGQVFDTIYEGYNVFRFKKIVSVSNLSSTNTSFTFTSVNDLGSLAARNAVSYIQITYPHTLDFEAKTTFDFELDDVSQGKQSLTVSNFSGGNSPVLYDLTNNKRIAVVKNGANYQSVIPNSGSSKKCFFAGESTFITNVDLSPVSPSGKFVNPFASNPNANYIIITHQSLLGQSASLESVDAYAAYRNSKGFNVLLVDVEDLYHQFSYGIKKNPLAIRNFLRAAFTQLNQRPEYLFLVGKAYYPQVYRKDNTYFNETLVPSFGSPPSDLLLTSYIENNSYKSSIAVGRLSAKNLDHVDLYLDKVMIYENPGINPPAAWKKQALFFSGGDDAILQNAIAGYMNGYEVIYTDTNFGGSVETYYKTTTDPIQISLSETIKKRINAGVNILNFFGHAAGVGFDISIDNPAEYSNYGKYPFLIANSCFAGDIFQPNVGVANSSEAFILIRDKGAIAYLGSVTPGSPPYLNQYTKSFFRHYSALSYGKPLGTIIYNSIGDIFSNSIQTKETILEMTLHGDPALVINSYSQPDYLINETSLFTTPSILTSEYDSFAVNIVIANYGKAIPDSFFVEVERTLPDKKTIQKRNIYRKSAYYKDTLIVWFKLNKIDDIGLNAFFVRIDANSSIAELNESNNTYLYHLDIKAADLKPVHPPKYAIVSSKPVLMASTFYPLSPNRDYIFQIDTTFLFNSPLLESSVVNSSGGVVDYQIVQPLLDSVVYYWRVSIDSTASKSYNWRYSSFHYIPLTTGWSQSHFYQFRDNSYRLTVYNEPDRKFEFVNDVKVLKCITGIVPYIAWTEPQYTINGVQKEYTNCAYNSMKLAVINPISGEPWVNKYLGSVFAEYGSYTCRDYDLYTFEFSTETFPPGANAVSDSAWFQRTADFIAQIPDGYYVLARSAQNSHITQWPEYLHKAYDSIGANFHRFIPDNRPYIVWGVKGQLGGASEVIGDSIQAIISLTDSFNTKWKEGFMITEIIGPTNKWNSLSWKVSSQDPVNTDNVHLALLGIESDGSIDTVLNNIPPDSNYISQLNDILPANKYPYCQVVLFMQDDSLHTPAYVDYIRLTHTDIPELAVAPKIAFDFHSDTIQRGDTMTLNIGYRNLSSVDLPDSLLIHYWLIDNQNVNHDLGYKYIAPIVGNSHIVDSFFVPTHQLTGNCTFYLEINPVDTISKAYDQLEYTHANNSLEVPFFVAEDKSNPLLDITFDGIHILDGDIVSARPEIIITLLDDNVYMPVDDTTLFYVYLSEPGNLAKKRVYFSKNGIEQMKFLPGELPENKAKIIFNPEFMEDGEYILYVQAADATLNSSGINDFQISFSVINKSSITHLLNWPNPFTSKTHFVFTLTGAQLPDYMLIQIMTISGKVVREIDMSELGPIHIGRNITEFAWDGTDEFGDRLANGVYLYRVITKLSGESVELRQTEADSYFTKEFGKMYLIR